MKYFKLLYIFLSFSICASAQYNTIKDLQSRLALSRSDTSRLKLNISLMYEYYEVNLDSTLYYGQNALAIAQKLHDYNSEGDAIGGIGYSLYTSGNFSEALKYYMISIDKYKLSKNEVDEGVTYRNIGQLYRNEEDYRQAIGYYKDAVNHERMGKDNGSNIRLAYMALGEVYDALNKLDSATYYTRKADELSTKLSDSGYYGRILEIYGNIYSKLGKKSLALKNYNESVKSFGNEKNLRGLCYVYLDIARFLRINNEMDSGILYGKKTFAIADSLSYSYFAMNATKLLSELYLQQHQVDSAFKYLHLNVDQKDSLFSQEKIREFQLIGFNKQLEDEKMETAKKDFKAKVKIYALLSGLVIVFLLAGIFWRNNFRQRKLNKQINKQKEQIVFQNNDLEKTLDDLKSAQAQLIQSEKMASLGELTAGIAHEIQNPLNFVNNFSELNTELIEEMKAEMKAGNSEDAIAIANDISENEQKINHHGKRAGDIVKGMLQHSRKSTGIKEPTNINALVDEYLRLSYHGLMANDKTFDAKIKTDFDETIGSIIIVPQDIGRVLLNLYNNAFYAVIEKEKSAGTDYEPTVSVSTKKIGEKLEIRVKDSGNGIPPKIVDKIFQPFFTTKPTGVGTGLGLSLSYDIVKAHGGEIKVETKEGEGCEFLIQLPIS